MKRLFSTFANGWPGAGLLVMRVVAGSALIHQGLPVSSPLAAAAMIGGALLIVGFWTPIAGTGVALIELWHLFSAPKDPLTFILLGTLGIGLSMVGPGAWSIDARRFGWKRIDIPERRK